MPNIYSYSELKNILKVGDIVRAVPGALNICGQFKNIGLDTQKITEVADEYFRINGCGHGWDETGFLEILPRHEITWDTLQVGDQLADEDGDIRTVLGVCGRVIFPALLNQPYSCWGAFTKEELINEGFSIVQPSPVETTVEMTVAEVSKALGKNVKIVKE